MSKARKVLEHPPYKPDLSSPPPPTSRLFSCLRVYGVGSNGTLIPVGHWSAGEARYSFYQETIEIYQKITHSLL
jgi:hypothetical protein